MGTYHDGQGRRAPSERRSTNRSESFVYAASIVARRSRARCASANDPFRSKRSMASRNARLASSSRPAPCKTSAWRRTQVGKGEKLLVGLHERDRLSREPNCLAGLSTTKQQARCRHSPGALPARVVFHRCVTGEVDVLRCVVDTTLVEQCVGQARGEVRQPTSVAHPLRRLESSAELALGSHCIPGSELKRPHRERQSH